MVNVGKYTINGCYGLVGPRDFLVSGPPKQKQRHPSNPKRYAGDVAVGGFMFSSPVVF